MKISFWQRFKDGFPNYHEHHYHDEELIRTSACGEERFVRSIKVCCSCGDKRAYISENWSIPYKDWWDRA